MNFKLAYGLQLARLERNLEADDVRAPRRLVGVCLGAKRLPVQEKLHGLAVRVDAHLLLLARLSLPRARLGADTDLHVVPLLALALSRLDGDPHNRFVRDDALEEIRRGERLQRVREDGVAPALLRPAVRLAPVFHRAPPRAADGMRTVHPHKRRLQFANSGLALEDVHLRLVLHVARIVHPPVVEGREVCRYGELRRLRIALALGVVLAARALLRREHRDRRRTRRIPSPGKRLHEAVHRHSPVAEALVSAEVLVHLKLVPEAPCEDRGMVAVALDPVRHELRPYLRERTPAEPIASVAPLVDKLVEDEKPHFIREIVELLAVRIVRATYRIVAELLHRLELPADRPGIRRRANEPEVVVVRHGGEEHLASVELESVGVVHLDLPHSESHLLAVNFRPVVDEAHIGRVEVRRVNVPELRVLQRDFGKLDFLMPQLRPRRTRRSGRDYFARRILYVGNDLKRDTVAHAAKPVKLDGERDGGISPCQLALDEDSVPSDRDLRLCDELCAAV